MFRTIKVQILLVLAILVLLLISQVYLSRSIQSVFVESLDLTQKAVIKVSLVRELERDVIDLQRNVLIYKDSASETAITRFNSLMLQSQSSLSRIEQLISDEKNSDIYTDYISRMRAHLNDYKENFESVIAGRTERQSLYNTGLLVELETLFKDIMATNTAPRSVRDGLEQAKYHIARAQNLLLQYLQTPDQQIISPFQQQLLSAKSAINQQLNYNADFQLAVDKLNNVEKDFLQLTQVTRGYLFLVNVVMTGSANEFLFLTRELNRLVTDNLSTTNTEIKQSMDQTQFRSDFFSVFGILLATITAVFLAYRIMVPINSITHIFQLLAQGKDVSSIPGLNRRDEIGQLAKAANVFHEKNKQTTLLLEQSQLLNAQQEALNHQLVASNKEVEQATASKSMFLANMSHEIRTPMNGIIGMLEVVLRTELTATQREYLNKAAYSGQILMSLINDILDFSKIEAGKLDIEAIEFSVESLFSNVLANTTMRAKEKNLNVRFDVDPNLPAKLTGDPLRISQVLLNLSSNAVKFTRNGQVSLNIGYEPHQDTNLVTLHIEIIDTGIGMSPEHVSKIFESFTQADGSTSRNYGGTGLGLTIVTQLVELMGGSVSVQSKENEGSIFKVDLCLTKSNDNTPVLCPIENTQVKVYYFTEGRNGLLNTAYLDKLGLTYHHFPFMQLPNTLDKIQTTDVVVMDIESLEAFEKHQASINKLVPKVLNLGFVTPTQPSNLPNQLMTKWPVECLSHPFTPLQAGAFIQSLCMSDHALPSEDPLINSHTEAAQYHGHLLLVEDNSINQAVAGEMLKSLGLTFDLAQDGQQAVTKVINSPEYDLVLMDIQMPIMDGYTATKTLREHGHNDLIICGLSANAMKQDYIQAKEAGMDDYIVKPLKFKRLEALLAKYLAKK